MTQPLTTRHYQFHGVNLAVSGTAALLEAMLGRLRYFPSADTRVPDLHFEFISLAKGEPPPVLRPVGRARALGRVSQGGHALPDTLRAIMETAGLF